MSRIEATFVIPIIQKAYIKDMLKTLYEFTPINFRTVIVDNTRNGLYSDSELWREVKPMIDLYLIGNRNFCFAKSMNEGIIHGLHWGSKYVVACNDDIFFINKKWWSGILAQFETYSEMMAVNPASVLEPGFGYGLNRDGTWVTGNKCPGWGVQVGGDIWPKKLDGKPLTFEEAKTDEGYEFLLEHRGGGHIEGFAGWCVVGKREMWENVGLYDERFTNGAEDYDLVHRIYLAGGRASATMRSFAHHLWGKSKDILGSSNEPMETRRKPFQDTNALYEHHPDGANSPIFPPRENEKYGNKRRRKSSGIFIDDPR